MTEPRRTLYKINLVLNNGKKHPIIIAAYGKDKLQELFNKNKFIYSNSKAGICPVSFEFVEEKFTVQMSEAQYDDEITHCDIVEELPQEIKKGNIVSSTLEGRRWF